MNKTTRDQLITHKKSRTMSFLTLMLLLCVTFSFGQFKINSNTTFTANNVVSSKEEVNILNSNMLGDDQLVLNGKQQHLVTSTKASLPTLRVVNADELVIKSELKLRGDLIVESGMLQLEHAVHIEGDLILQNDALVGNPHFIIYHSKHVFDKGIASTISSESFTPTLLLAQMEQFQAIVPFEIQNESFNKESNLENQFNEMPFSPPPEKSLLT